MVSGGELTFEESSEPITAQIRGGGDGREEEESQQVWRRIEAQDRAQEGRSQEGRSQEDGAQGRPDDERAEGLAHKVGSKARPGHPHTGVRRERGDNRAQDVCQEPSPPSGGGTRGSHPRRSGAAPARPALALKARDPSRPGRIRTGFPWRVADRGKGQCFRRESWLPETHNELIEAAMVCLAGRPQSSFCGTSPDYRLGALLLSSTVKEDNRVK